MNFGIQLGGYLGPPTGKGHHLMFYRAGEEYRHELAFGGVSKRSALIQKLPGKPFVIVPKGELDNSMPRIPGLEENFTWKVCSTCSTCDLRQKMKRALFGPNVW